jgi:hypothetical protein
MTYLDPWLPVRLNFCCNRPFTAADSSSESAFHGLLRSALPIGRVGAYELFCAVIDCKKLVKHSVRIKFALIVLNM